MRNSARKRIVEKIDVQTFAVSGGESDYIVHFPNIHKSLCVHSSGEFLGNVHQEGRLCCHKLAVEFFLNGDKALEFHNRSKP
jgi:predicted nucleic acid-binding Zn finger protein